MEEFPFWFIDIMASPVDFDMLVPNSSIKHVIFWPINTLDLFIEVKVCVEPAKHLRQIHTALCHILAKRLVNYNSGFEVRGFPFNKEDIV